MFIESGISLQFSQHGCKVATNKQPRGRKLPQLLSEFDSVKTIRSSISDEPPLSDKRTLTRPYHGIPAGSKLLDGLKRKGDKLMRMMLLFEFLD